MFDAHLTRFNLQANLPTCVKLCYLTLWVWVWVDSWLEASWFFELKLQLFSPKKPCNLVHRERWKALGTRLKANQVAHFHIRQLRLFTILAMKRLAGVHTRPEVVSHVEFNSVELENKPAVVQISPVECRMAKADTCIQKWAQQQKEQIGKVLSLIKRIYLFFVKYVWFFIHTGFILLYNSAWIFSSLWC